MARRFWVSAPSGGPAVARSPSFSLASCWAFVPRFVLALLPGLFFSFITLFFFSSSCARGLGLHLSTASRQVFFVGLGCGVFLRRQKSRWGCGIVPFCCRKAFLLNARRFLDCARARTLFWSGGRLRVSRGSRSAAIGTTLAKIFHKLNIACGGEGGDSWAVLMALFTFS